MEIALQQIASMGPDKRLDLSQLGLTELPPLPPDVKVLRCYKNKLTRLPQLPKTLKELRCDNNLLEELPELPSKLEFLNCGYNQITKLPNLPKRLLELTCRHNYLESLPLLPKDLYELDCLGNLLKSLPDLPDEMRELQCSLNQLTKLPKLPSNLLTLDCTENKLTTLPRLPMELENLEAYGNPFVEPFRTLVREYSLHQTPEGLNRLRIFIDRAHDLIEQGKSLRPLLESLHLGTIPEGTPSSNVLANPYGPTANIARYFSDSKGSLKQQMKALEGKYRRVGKINNDNGLPLPYGPSDENFLGGKRKTRRKSKKRKTRKQ